MAPSYHGAVTQDAPPPLHREGPMIRIDDRTRRCLGDCVLLPLAFGFLTLALLALVR